MISNHLSITDLASASWENGLLNLKPGQASSLEAHVNELADITRIVKAAFSNQQTHESAARVAERCWQYAAHIRDCRLALLACQICKKNLPAQESDSLDRRNRTDFELVVGGKRILLPGYYQPILSEASPCFKQLFTAPFNEKQTGIFRIEDIEYSLFKVLLGFLADGEFTAKEMPLDPNCYPNLPLKSLVGFR